MVVGAAMKPDALMSFSQMTEVELSDQLDKAHADEYRDAKRAQQLLQIEQELLRKRPERSLWVHAGLWQGTLLAVLVTDSVMFAFKVLRCSDPLRHCMQQENIFLLWLSMFNVLYGADVVGRMRVFGMKGFLAQMLHLLEVMALVGGFCHLLLVLGAANALSWTDDFQEWRVLLWSSRMLRWFRWMHLARPFMRSVCAGKDDWYYPRRIFWDRFEDYNLDLTHITTRFLAMSGPTDRCVDALFRNCVMDVARYMEQFYPGRYLVINAWPECPYDRTAFLTGEVMNLDVQDDTPPTMRQLLECGQAVMRFLQKDEGNVVLVHCKEARGRSATLVCSWMLSTGVAHKVENALSHYFTARSGDDRKKRVETPSQLRYLRQLDKMMSEAAVLAAAAADSHSLNFGMASHSLFALSVPPPNRVSLSSIRLENIWVDGYVPPNHLVACIHEVQDGSHMKLIARSQPILAKSHIYQELPFNQNIVGEDIRISVFNADLAAQPVDIPRAGVGEFQRPLYPAGEEPGCLLFFYIHCAFLDGSGVLQIQVGKDSHSDGLDKAYRCPHIFNRKGQAVLKYVADQV